MTSFFLSFFILLILLRKELNFLFPAVIGAPEFNLRRKHSYSSTGHSHRANASSQVNSVYIAFPRFRFVGNFLAVHPARFIWVSTDTVSHDSLRGVS